MGDGRKRALRVKFDRRLKIEFHGAKITSDAGLILYREMDDILGLTAHVEEVLQDPRTRKNNEHRMTALLRKIQYRTLTTLLEKLIKISAKVVQHSGYVMFQMAEVAVPRDMFAAILDKIAQLRICRGPGWNG